MHILIRIFVSALFLMISAISHAGEQMPSNDIHVAFDLEHNTIRGISKITLPSGTSSVLDLSGLRILAATINGMPLIIDPDMTRLTCQPSSVDDTVEISYEAEFGRPPETEKDSNPGVVKGNSINPNGVFLMDRWYPAINGLSLHRLTALLPAGFEAVSEADKISVTEKPDGNREFSFSFPHRLGNITLIAAKYVVGKDTYNGIDIYTYFLPDDTGLSKTYIDYTKKYLELYEKSLVSYPFKRFAIVENIQPTGYALPTFTLLGRDVIRLPFIVNTSLGHEILHQWFGNLVYIDYRSGNWSEGLTTYLADHMYEQIKDKGWDYRKQMLISFQSYVSPENEISLTSFSGRADQATKSVGYGKAAMVFHMLKDLVGEEQFFAALRTFIEENMFRTASWNDIKGTFEAASSQKLDWFFRQWVEEKGSPDIGTKNINLAYRGSKAIVSFDVIQKGKNYRLNLPITVKTREGEIRKVIELDKESQKIEIETDGSPVELIIDKNYDLFRRLADREFPPVISRLLGAPNKIFLVPQGREKDYEALSSYLTQIGFTGKKEGDISYDDIKSASLIILNNESPTALRLFGKTERKAEGFSLSVRLNPFNKRGVIAVAEGSSPDETGEYITRVPHYGKYSDISFINGKNNSKTIAGSQRGIREKISGEVMGLELPRVITVPDMIEKAGDKKIIYVGELHDRFDNHRVQFEVIRALHRKNKKIAIGMEMFQKPFQKTLDAYISGHIDEREFLKKSEYFKRWGFDYNLYREIMLYAREFEIPVIALNIGKEIVSKVSKEGIHALTPDELKEIPEDIDFSDSEYTGRLRESFSRHGMPAERNFDFFYQAQVLWDEAMAHNLNAFIEKHPEHQVIVLAGAGHMAFGSGIPKRAYRLNKEEYSIVLNNMDVERDIADFLFFPEASSAEESPRLMAQLKEEKGSVRILNFIRDSVSEKAGLEKDDVILAMDDVHIEGIDDIKIFLLYKKKGDVITATVLRQRFILGPIEKKFRISL